MNTKAKDELYLKIIQRNNNFDYMRIQNIENKNINLINIASLFLAAGSIFLGIIANLIIIPYNFLLFFIIVLLGFFISILFNFFSLKLKESAAISYKEFIRDDETSISKKIRELVLTEVSINDKFKYIIGFKRKYFKINYVIILVLIIVYLFLIILIFINYNSLSNLSILQRLLESYIISESIK